METVWQTTVGDVRFEGGVEGVFMRISSNQLNELEGA